MNAEIIASVTTAAGTFVLAVATFSATRSANRASRIAERSLLATLTPVLMNAQLGDPMQKVALRDPADSIYDAFAEATPALLAHLGGGAGGFGDRYPHNHANGAWRILVRILAVVFP